MPKLSKSKLDSFIEMQEIFNIKDLFDLENVKVSEGVMYVATEGQALWLIGSIARLQAGITDDFQLWRVDVYKDLSAELSCRNRHGEICYTKSIPKVIDFGLPELELCVVKPQGMGDFMLMLPREANNYYGDKLAPLLKTKKKPVKKDTSKWAKDYGLHILNTNPKNVGPPIMKATHFSFFHIAVLEPGSFTTTSNYEEGGEEYAATIDFDNKIFEKILATLPAYKARQLREFVNSIEDYPVMIRFEEDPIEVTLRAQLGTLQHGDGEDFIPFIAIDVSKAG